MCGCGARYNPPRQKSQPPTSSQPATVRTVGEEKLPAPRVRNPRSGYIPPPPKRR